MLVDPIGPRPALARDGAVVAGPDGYQAWQVRLPAGPSLADININFDTVYLAADTARVSKTYRILGCDAPTRTLTLDGAPVLDGGRSAWQIPAGLGARFEPILHGFPADRRGMDHYAAALFLVYDGRIHAIRSWTSMTSVRYDETADNRTSIRGNTEYHGLAWVSGDDWKAYCFQIVTPGNLDVDKCSEARFYFDGVGNPPGNWPAPVGRLTVERDPDGKGRIRIHDGHTKIGDHPGNGTGSAGCLVSPHIHELRSTLIDLHQEERALLGMAPNPDPALAVIGASNTRALAQQLYQNSHATPQPPPPAPVVPDAGWLRKLAVRVWVIRPEERPTA